VTACWPANIEPLLEKERWSACGSTAGDPRPAHRLSAGGTAELLTSAGPSRPPCNAPAAHGHGQRPDLKPLYAHCLGGGPKPRITVTTHPAADGQWVWYLGGDIAEADGVAREPAEQIATAQKELGQSAAVDRPEPGAMGHLRVDRAEPLQSGLVRPDNAFLAEQAACWWAGRPSWRWRRTSPTG
jgi:hypothetical protein